MKKQILISIVVFLALIPFRLPISIILIKGFTWINTMSTSGIPLSILVDNVQMTKGVYDVVLGVLFLVNVSRLIIHAGKTTENKNNVYGPVFLFGGLLMAFYVGYDVVLTGALAEIIMK